VRIGGLGVEEVAPDVHVHQPVVVRQRRSQQARLNPDPGVVDQHVEGPEMLGGQIHRARYRRRIASVGGHEPARASIAQCRLSAHPQLLIPPGHCNPRALAQEPLGDGEADAGRTPGDQHVLALQPSRADCHIHLVQLLLSVNEPAPEQEAETPLCRALPTGAGTPAAGNLRARSSSRSPQITTCGRRFP
jgi:hypothetical protein